MLILRLNNVSIKIPIMPGQCQATSLVLIENNRLGFSLKLEGWRDGQSSIVDIKLKEKV